MDTARRDAERQLREALDYRYREITEESAIDVEVAHGRGYYLATTKTVLDKLGFARNQQRNPAIVISRFSPSGETICPQIKPDSPREEEKDGKISIVKYETPKGAPVRLSVHPRTVNALRDIRYQLWATEGDKKPTLWLVVEQPRCPCKAWRVGTCLKTGRTSSSLAER